MQPVLVVPKKSLYERFALEVRDRRFLDLLQRRSPLVSHVADGHARNQEAWRCVVAALEAAGVPVVVKSHASRADARDCWLVVAVGGDGTLLDAAHRVEDRPVLGINSDPRRSVGTFCAATVEDFPSKLQLILSGAVQPVAIPRMDIRINGRRLPHPALNDVLFAHRCPAAITEYELRAGDQAEVQRSSGVWISTAAGSTGAMRAAGGEVMPLDSPLLQYLVREPYRADGGAYRLGRGLTDGPIEISARVFDAAAFIDGHRLQRRLRYGDCLRLEPSARPLYLFRF
jgi:NAD+ kinase